MKTIQLVRTYENKESVKEFLFYSWSQHNIRSFIDSEWCLKFLYVSKDEDAVMAIF